MMYYETSHFLFLEYSFLVYFVELNKSLFRKYVDEEAIRSFKPDNGSTTNLPSISLFWRMFFVRCSAPISHLLW